MSAWIRVAPVADFALGSHRVVDVEGVRMAVFHVMEGYYAIEDTCTHDGGELASGELQGCEIICPRHGARFDIRTGVVKAPPAYEAVSTFPVRENAGWVEVCDDRWGDQF